MSQNLSSAAVVIGTLRVNSSLYLPTQHSLASLTSSPSTTRSVDLNSNMITFCFYVENHTLYYFTKPSFIQTHHSYHIMFWIVYCVTLYVSYIICMIVSQSGEQLTTGSLLPILTRNSFLLHVLIMLIACRMKKIK